MDVSTPAHDTAAGDGFPRWSVFPVLALGTFMATLDISIVNIALPTLARGFHVALTSIEWVVVAYVATISGLLLTFGRLADQYGRRLVYGLGLLVFTAASALCAAAPGAAWLIAARALQGLGAAMMTANSAAILASSFPVEERGRALGAFGAMVGAGLSIGPPLGGLLVAHLSWRWIFILNLPLGILALVLLPRLLPADVVRETPAALALPSAALWSSALVLLMLGLSRGPVLGWGHPAVAGMLAGALLVLAAFVVLDRRSRAPLLPLDIVRGSLARAALLTLLGNLLAISVGFQMPIYLEEALDFDAAKSGQWLALVPVAALVLAPLSGRWSDRWGSRPLATIGMTVTAAGLLVLARLGLATPAWLLLGGLALVGVGQGLFAVPNTRALLAAAPAEHLGLASGLQATVRNLGFALGAGLTAAFLASRFAAHGGGVLTPGHLPPGGKGAFAAASDEVYLALAALALLGAVVAARTPPAPPQARRLEEASRS